VLIGPPHTWPEAERMDFEERAAIMEFDGWLTTAQAETAAEAIVRASTASGKGSSLRVTARRSADRGGSRATGIAGA